MLPRPIPTRIPREWVPWILTGLAAFSSSWIGGTLIAAWLN